MPVKKLHKLLYYTQGHHLAAFGEPMFVESISAWDMGPVVGELWWKEREANLDLPRSPAVLTEAELNTIGYVLSRYGNLSGNDLERLTHSEPPWIDADAERRRTQRNSHKISTESLRLFFSEEGRSAEDDSATPVDADALSEWFAAASARPDKDAERDSPESLLARQR